MTKKFSALLVPLLLFAAPAAAQEDAAESSPAAAAPAPETGSEAQALRERGEVFYDPGLLPDPVRQMRDRILEAAMSGDLEKLRAVAASSPQPPVVSLSGEGDNIDDIKEASNDGEGREIMAILSEIMEAGYVHVDRGTPQEMYVWPYFAQYPLDKLTPPQLVEMFRVVTAFEYKEMTEFGAYNFYRVGIGPDGLWHFFVAGD
jgi:hypothetical protein